MYDLIGLSLSALRSRQPLKTSASPFFGKLRMASLATKGQSLVKAVVEGAQPKFQLFMKYARVELAPPTPADIPQIRSGVQKLMTGFRTGRWKQLTVKEAWLNTLVTAEVCFWFFVGECIGKRHIVGYKV